MMVVVARIVQVDTEIVFIVEVNSSVKVDVNVTV
jgi:hypothetical protein